MRKRNRFAAPVAMVGIVGLVSLAFTAPASAATPSEATTTSPGTTTYQATLSPVSLNTPSGAAAGHVTVTLDGNQATVSERVSGLADKLPTDKDTLESLGIPEGFAGAAFPHVQHIHIDGAGTCPSASADSNGDGVISTVEGRPAYGKIGTTLSTGDAATDTSTATKVTVAPSGGSFTYQRTFTMNDDTIASLKDGSAMVVVHGLDPATAPKASETTANSLDVTLPGADKKVALIATAPALCGSLQQNPVTYTTSLNPLNNESASGKATVVLDGDQARVTVDYSGLADKLPTDTDTLKSLGIPAKFAGAPFPHVQHIHVDGNHQCPGSAADTNHDGVISTVEGRPAYGKIGTTLSTKGATDASTATDITVAPGGGTAHYERTFTMNAKTIASLKDGSAVIVVHGLNPATAPKASETTPNSLGAKLPGADKDVALIATAPALCGALTVKATPPTNPDCVTQPFPDVPVSSALCGAITWLSKQHITKGDRNGDFNPTDSVSRQAMAAFMARFEYNGKTAPKCDSKPFDDVSTSSTFCGAIHWLATQKITIGYAGNDFRPRTNVSRQQMAAFVYRLMHDGKMAPGCTSDPFTDVSTANTFCGAIAWLKAQGITQGYTDNGFHPTANMSRQAMAAFLGRVAVAA